MPIATSLSSAGSDVNTDTYLLTPSLAPISLTTPTLNDSASLTINGSSNTVAFMPLPAIDIASVINPTVESLTSNPDHIGYNSATGNYILAGSIPGTTVTAKASSAMAENSYAVVGGNGQLQFVTYNKAANLMAGPPAVVQSQLMNGPAGIKSLSQPIGPGSVVFSYTMSDASLDGASGGYGSDDETFTNNDQGNYAAVLGNVSPQTAVLYAQANLGGDMAAVDLQAASTPAALDDFLTKTQQAQNALPSSEPAGDVANGYAELYNTVNHCVAIGAAIGEASLALIMSNPILAADALSIGNAAAAADCALTGYNNYNADEKAAIGDLMHNLGTLKNNILSKF